MSSGKIICILGVTGEHLGPYIARWAVKKDGVVARILVRDGFQAVEKKKKIVDELLQAGCELHLGDATDVNSLVSAFTGADIVISSLGGWGDLGTLHDNIYEACKTTNVRRIVPAQYGVDLLSLDASKLDPFMQGKLGWNLRAIESGIPYTIVSQGAFSEWMCTLNPNLHLDTCKFDCVGDLTTHGWLSVTTLSDTGRFIIDVACDPEMANARVSITGSRVTPNDVVQTLSTAFKKQFTINVVDTVENAQELVNSKKLDHGQAFLMYIRANCATGEFQKGFEAPFLIDTMTRYGWTTESFLTTAIRMASGNQDH
jgi:uncharacterized protein YbjT (DUF2867 family)